MKRILNPIASAALVAALSLPAALQAFEWSDNFIGYRTGTTYREPVNSKDISKDILQFQHVDGYKYGTNFVNIDYCERRAGNRLFLVSGHFKTGQLWSLQNQPL